MMQFWLISPVQLTLLVLFLSTNFVRVQANNGLIGSSPALRLPLVKNSTAPSPSQVQALPSSFVQDKKAGQTPVTIPSPATSIVPAAKNGTTDGSGGTGAPVEGVNPKKCLPDLLERSMARRRRSNWGCETPGTLQPADGLVPNTGASSKGQSKPQPASSPIPQAASEKSQTDSQHLDSQDSQQANSQQTGNEQGKSQGTNAEQAGPEQAKSQETTVEHTDSKQTGDQVPETVSPAHPAPAAPNVVAATTDAPLIVQGQAVPADGTPITVNNQAIRVSSGYIYVGSSSIPIPKVQVAPQAVEPIVAGSLSFEPSPASPTPQVVSSPFVVAGLIFSAAQPAPSDDSNIAPGPVNSRPLIVGGKVYAPIAPSTQSGAAPAANNAANNEENESEKHDSPSAPADSKSIVVGGMTYTPIAANPTPAPQNPAVFSFHGTAITQGGPAVTISGTRYSLGPSAVVIGTSSLPFTTSSPTKSLLTVGSETLTALSGNGAGFEIDHSTLLPGSPAVTISGTVYSINQAGSLIAGTSTIPLATADQANPSDTALTAGGETFTPLGSTAVVVDGTTISIGGSAITENGTRITLASNGLLVGSSTFAYATPAPNAAALPTATGVSTTGVVPQAGSSIATYPGATAGAGTSAASSRAITPGMIMAVFVVSVSLSWAIFTL